MGENESSGPRRAPSTDDAPAREAAKPGAQARDPDASAPRDMISDSLKRLFSDVEEEPMPERFRTLLDRLARESDDEGGPPDK